VSWWSSRSSRVLADRYRDRVVVTLKSGDTFTGALWFSDLTAVVLRGASAVDQSNRPVSIDGELILLLADISFIQRP